MAALPLRRRAKPAASGTHLRVVSPPPERHTTRFAVIIGLLCLASVFGTVSFSAAAAGDAVAIAELEEEVTRAESRYAHLVTRVAQLEDPARIERVAAKDLGMVPAEDAGFIVLDRSLPTDGHAPRSEVVVGEQTDPLKPVLSVEK